MGAEWRGPWGVSRDMEARRVSEGLSLSTVAYASGFQPVTNASANHEPKSPRQNGRDAHNPNNAARFFDES